MSIKAIPGSRMRAQPREHVVGYQPRWYARVPLHFVIIVISAFWLLPTLTLLFTSVRSIQDINTSIWWTLLWTPHQFTLENYNMVIHTATSIGMGQAFLNSLIITVPSTMLPILIGAGAAYAFSWLRFPLRNTIFLVLVALQVIPLQMLLIPLLRIFTDWHIVGT
jgi:alpha-glucoside transport system permease protein